MKLALKVAIVLLVLAVIPVWPYGYYLLLRVVVFAVTLYLAIAGASLGTGHRAALVVLAVLFNPVFDVSLTRLVWLPIDVGVAYYFWRLSESPLLSGVQELTRLSGAPPDEPA